MKNTLKILGIIALVAIIGIAMISCNDDDGGSPTMSSFSGIDLAANKYTFIIKNGNGRAAAGGVGDNYDLTITPNGGTSVVTIGTITGVTGENTFTLSNGGAMVTVAGETISSLVGEITLPNGQNFLVRTFDTVYLRATRYQNDPVRDGNSNSGENWNSLDSIKLADIYDGSFDDFISQPMDIEGFLSVKISGNVDKRMQWTAVEFGHMSDAGVFTWLGGGAGKYSDVSAGNFSNVEVKFQKSGYLTSYNSISHLGSGEVLVQVVNQIKVIVPDNPAWGHDSGTTIPVEYKEGDIIATLKNFMIEPVVSGGEQGELTGNLGNFHTAGGIFNNPTNKGWNLTAEQRTGIKNGTLTELVLEVDIDKFTVNALGKLIVNLNSANTGGFKEDCFYWEYYLPIEDLENPLVFDLTGHEYFSLFVGGLDTWGQIVIAYYAETIADLHLISASLE